MQKRFHNNSELEDNYVQLLEASNEKLYSHLRITKKRNYFLFLSFVIFVSSFILFFYQKRIKIQENGILKNHLTSVKFIPNKLLIQDISGKYYEINPHKKIKFLSNNLFIEIYPDYIKFLKIRNDSQKNYIFKIFTSGRKYQVILPDQTKILVNKNSQLTFSTERNVLSPNAIIEGEAFFNVSHNQQIPFVVKASNMKIKVLGTSFDVNNYKKNKQTKVSLLKGSIEIGVNGQKKKIKPGETAVYEQGKKLKIKLSNVYNTVNWTENILTFRELSLTKILKKLEKWYDIRFVVKNPEIKKIRFTGIVIKEQGIKQFLRILQYTENIRFKIEGNTIILTK